MPEEGSVVGRAPAAKYSNKQALIRNFKWYLENTEQFQATTGVSHRVPWNQGVLKVAKFFF